MDEEIWKPIGVEKYMISNWGNAKGINGEKPMKPQIVGSGHCQLQIWDKKIKKNFYVHRLVGEHFLEKPSAEKCLIDHIDRNKTNNHVSNLRWVTHQENSNNRHNSREPTEKVLKQREYNLQYKNKNSEKWKLYKSNNASKFNEIAKVARQQSKQEIDFQNWRRAMLSVHFIIKMKTFQNNI